MLTEAYTQDSTKELYRLRAALIKSGVLEYLSSFDPLDIVRTKWASGRAAISDPLRSLIDFLMLGQSIDIEKLNATLGDAWRILVDLNIASLEQAGSLRLNDYMLVATFGILFFVEPPKRNPKLYYSNDSFALLYRASIGHDERGLDLCAGSGIQALRLAIASRSVDAVERNPEVCKMTRINAALNGLSRRVNVIEGSLFDHIDDAARYDVVVSNPPFVPSLSDVSLPGYAEGGKDGLIVTREIILNMPKYLTPNGRAHLVGMLLMDESAPLANEEFARLAATHGLDIRLTLLTHYEISDESNYFKVIVDMAEMATGRESTTISRELRTVLDTQGAKAASTYSLFITRGQGDYFCQDLKQETPIRPWFL